MKLPRDISGDELIQALRKYRYRVTRQTGSHAKLASNIKGTEHHITVPRQRPIKIGTLNGILSEVAAYLEIDRQALASDLFK